MFVPNSGYGFEKIVFFFGAAIFAKLAIFSFIREQMNHHIFRKIALSACVCAICAVVAPGCHKPASDERVEQTGANVSKQGTQTQQSDEVFFESRVAWPEFDAATATEPVFAIESGTNSEGAWFEGKGYFRGSIEGFAKDMGDPMVMGPSNVTEALSKRNERIDGSKHHFDIHVEMDYLFTVEFDLTVDIAVEADSIHYESHKTSGFSMIDRIDEIILVRKMPNNWYSVEFKSRYDAVVIKEEVTKAHFEILFARWAQNKGLSDGKE